MGFLSDMGSGKPGAAGRGGRLVISGAEVIGLAFGCTAEEGPFPNVGAAVSADVFAPAFCQGEPFPLRISRLRLGVADPFAAVEGMRRRGRAPDEFHLRPRGGKISGGHGSAAHGARFSRLGMARLYRKARRSARRLALA